MPPQKHDFLYYQPKWRGRKIVRHFVAAVAIGSLTLTLSYWFKKTDQGWTRDTVISRKNASGPRDIITVATVVFVTSGATWTVPTNCAKADKVECIGGGGGGVVGNTSSAGAGGAYSQILNLGLTPNATVSVQIGTGGIGGATGVSATVGGDTWFSSSGTVFAKGGGISTNRTTPAPGGAAASGVGTTKFSGGNGGLSAGSGNGGGGAGGAAGPNGNGNAGASTSAGGVAGGSGDAGFGGAGGTGGGTGTGTAGTGGAGTEYDASHGSGGGGGGGGSNQGMGGSGGLYGGGGGGGGQDAAGFGGAGAQGLIVVTFTPFVVPAFSGLVPWDTSFLMSRNFRVVSY